MGGEVEDEIDCEDESEALVGYVEEMLHGGVIRLQLSLRDVECKVDENEKVQRVLDHLEIVDFSQVVPTNVQPGFPCLVPPPFGMP